MFVHFLGFYNTAWAHFVILYLHLVDARFPQMFFVLSNICTLLSFAPRTLQRPQENFCCLYSLFWQNPYSIACCAAQLYPLRGNWWNAQQCIHLPLMHRPQWVDKTHIELHLNRLHSTRIWIGVCLAQPCRCSREAFQQQDEKKFGAEYNGRTKPFYA